MSSGKTPTASWNLADLIDFEVLLDRESSEPSADWRQAWAKVSPAQSGTAPRRQLFRSWLEFRRQQPGPPLPGTSLATGWRWLATVGAFVGLLLGSSVTGGLLHYTGKEPVNVAWFLACTLGLQAMLLFGAAAFTLARRVSGAFIDFQPLRQLASSLAWACSSSLRRLPGEQRESLRARLAALERKREIYGSLTTWPILIVTQVFAIAFNIGILGVLLAHVAVTDLAFGWQSTLDLSPEAVHRIAATIALPWSWCTPSPHPSLPQIVASRFSYSGGITRLDPQAAASWWPFLAYAVAAYGCLLRLALLAVASIKLRSVLNAWPFDHEGCNALARRLSGPIVQTQENSASHPIPQTPTLPSTPPPESLSCLVLAADELALDAPRAARLITSALHASTHAFFPFQLDHPSGNASAIESVAHHSSTASTVVVLAPAHRSPIKAIALTLRRITDAAGPGREVILLLVGRPSGNNDSFVPVPDATFQHWRNLQAIHHLPLTLDRLTPAAQP